jgi:hypothetical protein
MAVSFSNVCQQGDDEPLHTNYRIVGGAHLSIAEWIGMSSSLCQPT